MERVIHARPLRGPGDAAQVVLSTRQLLHARLGLPLAAAGCWVLIAATVQYLNLERGVVLGIIAGAGALAAAAIAIAEWRARRQGLWAWAGNPSLAAPSDGPGLDPKTVARLQIGAIVVLGALVVGAYLYGVTVETTLFWIFAYGLLHMAIYCLLLSINLGMREHTLPLVWFIGGELWWLATGQGIAFIFGGGCLFMGLLLHARRRQFEKLAHSPIATGGSQEDAP